MATTKSNADRVREYFHRQYELEEGTAADNVYALFAEDAVSHMGEGKTATRETVARAAHALRQSPKQKRAIEVSDFQEEGDLLSFRTRTRFRNAETGELVDLQVDTVWRFNAEGKVIESRSKQADEVSRVFKAIGA